MDLSDCAKDLFVEAKEGQQAMPSTGNNNQIFSRHRTWRCRNFRLCFAQIFRISDMVDHSAGADHNVAHSYFSCCVGVTISGMAQGSMDFLAGFHFQISITLSFMSILHCGLVGRNEQSITTNA